MSRSIARIETEHASLYLQQLCKHFAHKLSVEFTPSQGRIPFTAGACVLAADDAPQGAVGRRGRTVRFVPRSLQEIPTTLLKT
jgi:hypothetical protein